MNNQIIFKKLTRLNFRQVIYVIIGLVLLVNGIVRKDWTTGILSLVFYIRAYLTPACSDHALFPGADNSVRSETFV